MAMAMAASLGSECPVCLETFTDPRMLPTCLHTLCFKCLQDHIVHTGRNGQFQCPECRELLPVPNDGAQGFPKNFFINRLMDVVEKSNTGARSKTGQSSCRSGEGMFCSNSEDGDDCGDRETLCLECCEYYCSVCSRAHRRSKVSRKHVLVSLEELTEDILGEALAKSQAPRCLKHTEKPLELYCTTCQKAVCYLCSRIDHSTHAFKDLLDVDEDLKTELSNTMVSLQQLMDETTGEMLQLQQSVQNSVTAAAETTMVVFQALQQMLKVKYEEVSRKLCQKREDKVSTADVKLKNLKLHIELLQSLHAFAENLLATGSVHNRLASLPDIRSRLQQFQLPKGDGPHTETPSSANLVSEQLNGLVIYKEFQLGAQGSNGPILEVKQTFTIRKNKDFQIVEKRGDLFEGSSDESLACCISGDLITDGSIAELFENKFGSLKELSKPKTGELIDIQHDGRYIYYLVTRKRHVQKQASSPLKKCLTALKEHCQKHQVQKLSMPQVNCEMDGVKWPEAAEIIEEVFKGTRIVVTAYGDNDRSAGGAVGKKTNTSNCASAKASKALSGPGVFHKEIKNFVFTGKEGNPIACMQDGEGLAYCVSADINPDNGFAATFQNYFGGVGELVKPGKKPGDVAVLDDKDRFIYYLVVKEKEDERPRANTLRHSLEAMRNHCLEQNVQKLSMPSGLFGFIWKLFVCMVKDVFEATDIEITVYEFRSHRNSQGSRDGRYSRRSHDSRDCGGRSSHHYDRHSRDYDHDSRGYGHRNSHR